MFDSSRHLTPDFARIHFLPTETIRFIHFNNLWGLPLECFNHNSDSYIENGETHEELFFIYRMVNAERVYALSDGGITLELKQARWKVDDSYVIHHYQANDDTVYVHVTKCNPSESTIFAYVVDLKTGLEKKVTDASSHVEQAMKQFSTLFDVSEFEFKTVLHTSRLQTQVINHQDGPYKDMILLTKWRDVKRRTSYFYMKTSEFRQSNDVVAEYREMNTDQGITSFEEGVVIPNTLPKHAFHPLLCPNYNYIYCPLVRYGEDDSMHQKTTFVYDAVWNVIEKTMYKPEYHAMSNEVFQSMEETNDRTEQTDQVKQSHDDEEKTSDDYVDRFQFPTQFYSSANSRKAQLRSFTLNNKLQVKFPLIEMETDQ